MWLMFTTGTGLDVETVVAADPCEPIRREDFAASVLGTTLHAVRLLIPPSLSVARVGVLRMLLRACACCLHA